MAGSATKLKPRAILLSKRANVMYLERARVIQKDDRVLFLTDTGEDVEQLFNIPERNTAFLLLGKGTSITDAAARKLADSNVMMGFCGSGGSPLHSATDITWLSPQSEYRPTEYMQAWMRLWLDEPRRLAAAKDLMRHRIDWTLESWEGNADLHKRKVVLDDAHIRTFEHAVKHAQDTQAILLAEAEWAKGLYARLAKGFGVAEFTREHGQPGTNSLLDHGNYIAYGYAAVALHGLGIPFSLPLLHGKTRRGALVFDVADLFKDALVMPLAFAYGKRPDKEFRAALIDVCQQTEVLDRTFDTLKKLVAL